MLQFCEPGDKTKSVPRIHGGEKVHTPWPVHTVPCAGGRILGTGPPCVFVLAHRLRPNGNA